MANAYTGTADLATLPKFYSKVFLERLNPGPKMMPLCIQKPLDNGNGTTIYFPRLSNFSYTVSASLLSEGTIASTGKVADAQVSAVIEQYGYPVALTDLSNLTAINDTVAESTRALADMANNVLDKRIINEAYGTSSTPWGGGFSAFAYNTVGKVDLAGSTSAFGTYVGITEYRMKADTLRQAVAKLRARNVQPFDDGYFKLVVHSDTATRLRADSEWQNAYQYTDADSIRMGVTSAFEGVQVIQDNNITTSANGSAGNTLYYSILLGHGGLGATELDGGVHFYTTPANAEKADPLAQFITIGWKANFVPKRLNVSCGLVVVTADTV